MQISSYTLYLALPGAVIWLGILLLPWRPWSTRETLDAVPLSGEPVSGKLDLSDVTVLIPARNEADTICQTLAALDAQGNNLNIILIDDQSGDDTGRIASECSLNSNLKIITGEALPAGWAGKLWALEQGRQHVNTPITMLLDADIEVKPGLIVALREKMHRDNVQFVSLMAALRMQTFWEKLLMPAFIYFFKLLYPFGLSNNPRHTKIAAAAGGCIMLETNTLEEIGGFGALKDALIDDCTLARKVKSKGHATWTGLTHSVISLRAYDKLSTIWHMVARTAYTQLHYSVILLALLTIIFVAMFWLPVAGLLIPSTMVIALSALALMAMMLSYVPTLIYYDLSPLWALAMPVIGTLYLAMTWTSAIHYWLGRRSQWKGRSYSKTLDSSMGK